MRIAESSLRRREMLLLLGCGIGVRAQDVGFTTGTKVVNVLASVRDKQGRHVHDLSQDDFEVREDGRLQQIRYFSRQTDVALTLGMLVDTSLSQRRVLEEERNAGREFFWQVLRPAKDSAFVIRFDIEVELTQDSTSSLTLLDKALDSLNTPSGAGRAGRGRGGSGQGGRGGVLGGIGTLLYDSVFLAADEVLKSAKGAARTSEPSQERIAPGSVLRDFSNALEGRKAVILLSDGVDHGSKVSLDRAVEAAQKADTSVYAIRIFDPNMGASGPLVIGLGGRRGRRIPPPARRQETGGEKALRRMAETTGGRYFEVSGKKPLEEVFREIEDELRNQYSLGYVSDRPGGAGEFRKITVATKRKGLTVQARNGYYAQP